MAFCSWLILLLGMAAWRLPTLQPSTASMICMGSVASTPSSTTPICARPPRSLSRMLQVRTRPCGEELAVRFPRHALTLTAQLRSFLSLLSYQRQGWREGKAGVSSSWRLGGHHQCRGRTQLVPCRCFSDQGGESSPLLEVARA